MKQLLSIILLILGTFSKSAIADRCFEYKIVKQSKLELRLDSKLTAYTRSKYKLPELTLRNMRQNSCVKQMLDFTTSQKSMRNLVSDLKTLEKHGFDDWMILRQAQGVSEHVVTNHAEQQFFLYAVAVGLGFNAAFSYNDIDDDSVVVWIASREKYSGMASMFWDTDDYYYISPFKGYINRDSYKNAFRDVNLKGKKISLKPQDWCFSTNQVHIPKATFTILGMQTKYEELSIELPEVSNEAMERCDDYILPFIQAQSSYIYLINKLASLKSISFNDWRLQLEIHALTTHLKGSKAQQKLLHYALSIGLGIRSAFSYHANNSPEGELFFDVKQSFKATQFTIDGYSYKRLFSFNNANYNEHYLLVSNRKGLKQLDMIEGMADYLDSRPPTIEKRTVSFVNKGVADAVTLEYNSLANDYWYTLPTLNVVKSKNAPTFFQIDSVLKSSIQDTFGSKDQCVEFDIQCHIDLLERILSFTGNGFEYKVDFDIYGEEKHMPLYLLLNRKYRYSDCDDRAIAFSTIAKVLGYESVLIFLPGHLASGVKLDSVVDSAKIVGGYHYAEATTTTGNVKLGRYQFDVDITRIIPIT